MLYYCNVQISMLELVIYIQNTIRNTIFLALAVCMQCIGIFQRWQTKVNLSIPECTLVLKSQGHLVDA